MATPTTNFALSKPAVPADDDIWGGLINANLDTIDARLLQGLGSRGARNYLINGDFRFNQRGAIGFTAAGTGYPVDRWAYFAVGGSGRDVVRIPLTVADAVAIGREEAAFAISYAVTGSAGASDTELLIQRIEGVRSLAGKTCTLSFWARRTTGAGNIASCLLQSFGTGGSPSANVTVDVGTHAVTSSWQRFTRTIAVPSITGKTVGTAGNDYLQVDFWFSSGSAFNARNNSLGAQTGTWQIADVQLEEGSVTPFVARPAAVELALCQRYYCGGTHQGTSWPYAAIDARMSAPPQFPTTMRVAPTMTFRNTAVSGAILDGRVSHFNGSWTTCVTTTVGIDANGVTSFAYDAGVVGNNALVSYTWTASAEL